MARLSWDGGEVRVEREAGEPGGERIIVSRDGGPIKWRTVSQGTYAAWDCPPPRLNRPKMASWVNPDGAPLLA
ncbi:MAG TPA: hypothetical protein ENJ50_07460 [Planctomycetaceae bacterium]|nr:hypothetical protein [Planctomycetaceae bacterium]